MEALTPPPLDEQECPVLRALGGYSELLSQGAEGRVFAVTLLSRPCVAKQRFTKSYRHPELDARLTRQRTSAEARSLLKARRLGVHTPLLLHVDVAAAIMYMERVAGESVKQRLRDGLAGDALTSVAHNIGRAVAKLHDGGLVHGDLTTSNMLLRDGDGQLVLIDFGLAFNSTLAEDKAVDLYVLERAITSAHASLTGLVRLLGGGKLALL